MKKLLIDLKPLRLVLLLTVLAAILLKPSPGTAPVYEGYAVFTTLLIPVLSPILLMLLWLDAIIAKVWHSQTDGEERRRYKIITIIDLAMSIVFLALWIPYFAALVG